MTNATTYRFGPCELDEARRSLSARGREIKLQPRVFDLLCYLVRHRERVVSKDELLDALWPGTVVVDNALQRVVSLARGALAEVGMGDAVRTYSRHGYRFCIDDCAEAAPGVAAGTSGHVAEARAACDRNDWVAACEGYAAADALSPLPPDDVEHWGRAAPYAPVLDRRPSARSSAQSHSATVTAMYWVRRARRCCWYRFASIKSKA